MAFVEWLFAPIVEFFTWLVPYMRVALMSMLPLVEVKGAIPFGVNLLGLPPWGCFAVALVGSFLPSPIIMLFFRPIAKFLRTHGPLKKFIIWLERRAHKKSDMIRKYSLFGLFLFVAVPLPGTGVWMGSLIATLLDLRLARALPVVFIGNVVASLCMLALGSIVLVATG
jgi:uncharacterized membrane protein